MAEAATGPARAVLAPAVYSKSISGARITDIVASIIIVISIIPSTIIIITIIIININTIIPTQAPLLAVMMLIAPPPSLRDFDTLVGFKEHNKASWASSTRKLHGISAGLKKQLLLVNQISRLWSLLPQNPSILGKAWAVEIPKYLTQSSHSKPQVKPCWNTVHGR